MILALGYVLAMLLTQFGAISSEVGHSHLSLKAKQSEVIRTAPETNFILYDYGIWLEPKKLSRRERLALALTNLADPGQ
ncbi:hypothetical protein [Limnohabitans sp. Jir72]|uniref:hypothetical protein n=1 Tax=Limnohabitans sp. Jir72 TaxID=1977909 RepID=UPI000D3BE022|nr:hypothetical protein [Limnohabitans sp. Jir72]PUE34864.1 hypothetical protein B9Z52_03060 [Limnohabitans sp. Jir72]